MHSRIHIFGASGSGTTTLGRTLGDELGIPHLDADSYYWIKTDPPFIEKNPPDQRVKMIRFDTRNVDSWILSGSICSWGDKLLGDFTHAVLLHVDPTIRMQRLYDREHERHGNRIAPGGDMHQQHIEFMAWAESYDTANAPVRSFDLHESWIKNLSCPVQRLDSNQPTEVLVQQVLLASA